MKFSIFSITFLLFSAHVNATQLQIGVWLGKSQTDVRGYDPSMTSVDDSDSSYRIEGSYLFSGRFSIEFGYVDQGEGQVILKNDSLIPSVITKKWAKSRHYWAADLPLVVIISFGKMTVGRLHSTSVFSNGKVRL